MNHELNDPVDGKRSNPDEKDFAEQDFAELETGLRATLHRRDPAPQFAERVVRAAVPVPHRQSSWMRPRRWMAVAAMLAVAAGLGVTGYLAEVSREQQQAAQQVDQQAAAEEAGRQAVLALQIASQHLAAVQEKVFAAALATSLKEANTPRH